MPRSRRVAASYAATNSSRSDWKGNQRLAKQLARVPAEKQPVFGEVERCGHGFNMARNPDHNCREYENAKRALRGAPPI